MYRLADHAAMVADATRTGAYLRALEQTVTPGCVVVDIGTGVGILALFAARLGAGRVYAIELDSSIQAAERIAQDNGLRERIEFIRDVSTAVSLKSKADIVVSDLHGVLPLFENHLPAIIDARRRLLAPGGVLIPAEERVYAAPVEAEARYADVVGPWEKAPLDLDLSAARHHAVNAWRRHGPGEVTPLAPGVCWATLNYRILKERDAGGECEWELRRAGTLHGFSVWFESVLADQVRLSNAPNNPGLIYGTAFFPLAHPVAVSYGDRVRLILRADHVAGDYVWRWETDIRGAAGNQLKAQFRQSTFHAAPLSLDSLQKSATDHRPGLKAYGRAALCVLDALENGHPLDDISKALGREHSEMFKGKTSAQQFVTRLLSTYGA